MNSYLLIFAIFLLIVLIVLIGFLVFLGFRYIKHDTPETLDKSQRVETKKSPFCLDHPDILSEGVCSLDGESYCEQCLTRVDDMKFARKNTDDYTNFSWKELTMFKQSKSEFDFNNRISKIKSELWKNQNIPLIVRGHFKINVETDSIETFTTLMCRDQDETFMRKELSFIKL